MSFEDIRLASFQRRGAAFFIDEILLSFLLVLAYSDKITMAAGNEEMLVSVVSSMTFPYMILKILYHGFFIYAYGATIGKFVAKIRCVSYQNERPNLSSAMIRSAFRIISEMVFYLGFLWAMFSPSRQTWHDKLAKTLVIDLA